MIGGVEAVVGAHAALLREAGHDVIVVAGRGDAERIPELDSRHRDVEAVADELAAGRVPPAYGRLRQRLAGKLAKVLKGREVVAVHNVLTMPFNLPAAEALAGLDLPLVAWTHDIAWPMPRYKAFHRRGHPWELLHTAHPGCLYVSVSRTRAREAESVLRTKVGVVPNGVDALALIGVGEHAGRLARRAGILDADPLVLVPTRITPRKRLELAIETAAELAGDFPDLKLAISGPLGAHSAENAAYDKALRGMAASLGCAENVVFMHSLSKSEKVHPVTEADMAGLYRLADVVLLPSESEGFGLPLLEGGLTRAPVVCGDLPVLREVGGGGVWRFRPGAGAAEVAELCRRALATRSARLRRRARRQDWRLILPRLEAVLAQGAGRA